MLEAVVRSSFAAIVRTSNATYAGVAPWAGCPAISLCRRVIAQGSPWVTAPSPNYLST
jgi:hypothetical protein